MIARVYLCYTDEAKGRDVNDPKLEQVSRPEEKTVTIDDLALMIGKGFREIDQRFAQIDQRFARIDQRFVQIEERFTRIDKRFDDMDRRFDRIEGRQEIQQRTLEFHDMRLRTGNL
jgi:hypothetical protein